LESLLAGLGAVCAGFSDARRSTDVDYSMADIGLSAFSLFFMQSESFLSTSVGWSKAMAHRIARRCSA